MKHCSALFAGLVFMAPAAAQFSALPNIDVGPTNGSAVPVATESDYVPNVVLCENGGASFEALKAQAVAARTFAYYKMDLGGFIRDGTSDQVYSCAGSPQAIHHAAAAATEGEILWVRDNIGSQNDVLIASFYVAGAIPTGPFDPNDPSAIPNPGDSDPTDTEKWIVYTYENNLSGGFNIGTPLGFQGTPTNPNWPNRGAKSQNGADFLSDNSISYVDILKYYYGADIQLRTATTVGTGITFGLKTLTNFDDYGDRSGNTFDGHEGFFHRSPTFSGSTSANVAGSTAERSAVEQHGGTHSQLIDINYDEASGTDFLLRHLSGARFSDFGGSSNAASRVSNLQVESIGSIGFWLKTDAQGITASLAVDDPATGDRGRFKLVIGDGQWHKYQWFLERNEDWEAWAGVGGNGQIDGANITFDSIQFIGSSDAQIYLDDVFWNPQAVFSTRFEGDFNGDGVVSVDDYTVWRDQLGSMGVGLHADADDNGVVDTGDYRIWRANFGQLVTSAASLKQTGVPEPTSGLLMASAIVSTLFRFFRSCRSSR
ncbi:MAG: SpoIID/LytB domain-containing protein, partial [Aeoliella sp.]